MTLKVDGDVVVKATVNNQKLLLDWDSDWKAWHEFSSSSEITALESKANETLARADGTKGKGKKGRGRGRG